MNTKLKFIYLLLLYIPLYLNAQVTPIAGDYKIIDIGFNGHGDYTKNLILIHEIYDGTLLGMNNAVGTITAFRGAEAAFNRINVLEIKSSSAYNGISAMIRSLDDNIGKWVLKTCTYNGRKYLAVDVPYSAAYHNWGFKFSGWTLSTAENMKSVAYEVNGQALNTAILSNIQDYSPNMDETLNVRNLLIMANNVGIGTASPDAKLTVNGTIHTKEVKVDLNIPVPDYVFANDYKLKTLNEVEAYIKANRHLPEIPSARELEKKGLMLAEMNMSLLKKIEELTLYLIQIEKENKVMKLNQQQLEKRIQSIENK